jgi:type II secretory pathway component PulF
MFIKKQLTKLSFNTSKRNEFYTLVASFVEDGVPLFDAITDIHKRYEDMGDLSKNVTQEIIHGLRGEGGHMRHVGKSLTHYAPSAEAIAIDAGEQSGNVAKGFRMAARICATSDKIFSAIVSKLVYPIFLTIMGIGLLIFISNSIVPMMESVSPRGAWPIQARILGILADNIPFALPFAIALIVTYSVAFSILKSKAPATKAREFLDRFIFPWDIYCEISGAMVLTSISSLIAAGIPFATSVERMIAASSPWEKSRLSRILLAMRKGTHEGEALIKSGFFKNRERWLISVYGKRSNFSASLESLSEKTLEKTIAKTNLVFNILQNIMLIMIAILVSITYTAFLAIAMSARKSGGV